MDSDGVCYGALDGAEAKIDNAFMLCSDNDTNTEFAVLDTRTTSTLIALRSFPIVRFEAIVQSRYFVKRQRRASASLTNFPLSINVFGAKSDSDVVGLQLSKLSAYLQHPESLPPNIEYFNPQFLSFAGENISMNELVGTANDCYLDIRSRISDEVGSIFESLGKVTVEDTSLSLEGLRSRLETHQEGGLHFILQRENEDYSRRLSARANQIIRAQVEKTPSLSLGGLIADAMGLGKTLTMLSAILHSVSKADDFRNFYEALENDRAEKPRTKATLVVVSSAHFREDPQVLVLLMSIETGAVGLNLTVATHVHIVEPQWNPSVEEQAVARAVRMGQKREVRIMRYVMKKTVEQNIIDIQQRKTKLAKFTFDMGTEANLSETIKDLRFALDRSTD
ncbi:hypothetical protein GGR52DRAFT_586385 [Hypoxylon sp. FL1284]|nr:hypothetical protein GGR52DRAFT_586385 [Hypoxylon sp. FL1284]